MNHLVLGRLFILFYLLAAFSFLQGCASQAELELAYGAQTRVVELQAQRQQPKSLIVDCSKGCGKAVVEFIHHKDMQLIAVPRIRNSNDTLVETLPSMVNMFSWAAGAWAATEIINDVTRNAGGGNTTTTTNNSMTGDGNAVTDTTSTVGNTSTANNSSVNNSNNTTDRNDVVDSSNNSTNDRHDIVDNNSINNSYNPVDSNDAVSTPTIVTQPAPVIVDPVVVTNEVVVPAQVVNPQPAQVVDPVVIDPVIVQPSYPPVSP